MDTRISAPSSNPAAALSPSQSLLANLRAEVMRYVPFSHMDRAHVDAFIAAASQAYFAPGEAVISPQDGAVRHLYLIRQGHVSGSRGPAMPEGFQYDPGDLFPIGAVMTERAVVASYSACDDCFCLLVPADAVKRLAAQSAPFADFLNRRVLKLLELSHRSLQAAFASQTLAEQTLESPLGTLARKPLVAVGAHDTVGDALAKMHERHVGSVLVLDEAGAAQGILTRYDVLGRVTLPGLPLDAPVTAVMSSPVLTLGVNHTAHDAVLLMARHGIRHVPVTDAGRVVNLVSERDLFALQRLSLRQISTAIRAANDVTGLQAAARSIREFARSLLGQGVGARQLTELVSHLNDVLTGRLVEIFALEHGRDMRRACWLAFGSEGRGEQTIATDQDNGLVFESDDAARDRPAWLAFARDVNEALDACGHPLCRGNVMASDPECCLTVAEWCARFSNWIEHGAPEDLLHASIYFDFRPLAGRADLLQPMRELAFGKAGRVPRFMKQMATDALRLRPPLSMLGGLETRRVDGRETIDLKLQGTALFVDVARLYALAHGIAETSTRLRFAAVANAVGAPPQEAESWTGAFEFLQMLRLRVQIDADPAAPHAVATGNPNLVDVAKLSDIDRRVLRESLRIARRLQQRVELDYLR
jgi:CBS domain-containing protein